MEEIKWNDEWTLDHEIDEQHKILISILNNIINRGESILKSVTKLTEYAAIHFADEENFMIKAGYPDIKVHRKEHQEFTKSLLDMSFDIVTLNGEEPEETERLIEILEKFVSLWFTHHFIEVDREFIDWLNQGGGK